MNPLLRLLSLPTFEDPREQHKAKMLLHITVATGLISIVAFFIFTFLLPEYASAPKTLLSTSIAFFIFCLCYSLIQRGRIDLTAQILVLSSVFFLIIGSFFEFGILSYEVGYFVAPIAIAFLTINRRWGIAVTLVCMIALLSLSALNLIGIIPQPPPIPLSANVGVAAAHRLMIVAAVAAYFYASKGEIDRASRQHTTSEERTRQVLDLMADATLQLDAQGTILDMNTRATIMLGYSAADLIGQNASVLIAGRQHQDVQQNIASMPLNTPSTNQITFRTKDNREIIGERRSVKMELDGDIVVFSIIRDVTESIAIQAAFAENQAELAVVSERLSLVANNVPALMSFVGKGEEILFLSGAFARFGIDLDAAIGLPICKVFPKHTYAALQPYIVQTFAGNESIRFDLPVIRRDGSTVIIDTAHIPHIVDGETIGYFSLGIDVTEERYLAKELENSQQLQRETTQRLQLVTDNIPIRISYADRDRRILFANRQFKEALSGNWGEWFETPLSEFLPKEVYTDIEPYLAQAYSGTEVRFEHTITDENNNPTLISELNYLPHIQDDEVVGVFSFARDVTDERKREASLREAQRLESLGLMAGGIAHDFNNLLVAILGQSSLAQHKLADDHPARRHVLKSVQAAERAGSLTKQMLAYSGQGQFEIRPVNLNEMIQHNLHLFESVIGKHVNLTLDFQTDLPHIEADASQMQQVIMNLIINASQAIGKEAGDIVLKTAHQTVSAMEAAQWGLAGKPLSAGHYVSFAISDTGCGISKAQLDNIFEPFFSTKDEGSGLGLSAVLGIIRGHNGGIAVTSTVGKGTRFELLFPASAAWQAQHELPASVGSATSKISGKVLVIDDEPGVSETVADMLDLLNIECLVANGGREGLALFDTHRADIRLVLLDLMMPDMDGEETFQRLRAIDPDVTILITSGYSESEATKHFVGQDLAGFIQKPYKTNALFAKVSEAFETLQMERVN